MCTNITIRTEVEGSAKGPQGWFKVDTAHVSFDHPFHAPFDHSLNIDFVNEEAGDLRRVAIELNASSARALVENIFAALAQGEAEAGLSSVAGVDAAKITATAAKIGHLSRRTGERHAGP